MKTNHRSLAAARIGLVILAQIPLKADTPPEIIDPPLTQFAWLGRPVTFKVSYTNKTAMAFQWQWNGANLPDATNKTYRLANAQLTNNGDYRVVLSNSVGAVTSAVARLTVRDWPVPTGVSFTNLSKLEASLQNIMRSHVVPGLSLAIMKDQRLILTRGYGYAVPETGEQVQPDSLFRIASLTKAITATAVLRLVDEGRLNLEDNVYPLLNLPPPTFPGSKLDPRLAKITVRHLLNHTGGWNYDAAKNPEEGIGFDPQYWFVRCAQDLGITNGLSIRDLAGWITGFPLQSEPGAVWYYSNNGYILLGALIDQVTGRRYEEVVQSLLAQADVTRLRAATYIRAERPPDEVVQWLSPVDNIRSTWLRAQFPSSVTAELAYHYPRKLWPTTGGLATSPMDYARFVNAIDGHSSPPDLLTTNSVKTMLIPTPASRSAGNPYGMGWYVDPSNGEISHPGGLPDSAAGIVVRRLDGVTYVAFCSTYDDALFDDLKATIDSAVSATKSWPTNDLFPATMSYVSDTSGATTSRSVRFTVQPLPSPTGPRVPELAQFDTNMLSLLKSYGVPGGSLAVVKDDRLVLARGYGYADVENGTQVQPDSLFRLASLSKTITAAAVLKLVEEGKLSLEAHVFPLLNLERPAYPGATNDSRMTNITVQQLLWHSAGWDRDIALSPLGHAGFEPHWWPTYIARDLALTGPPTPIDAVRWVMAKPLQQRPGTEFHYSGAGFVTAGRMVEKVSGLSFGSYVSQMLAPAGISHIRMAGNTPAEHAPSQVVNYVDPGFNTSLWPYPIAEPKPIDVDYPYAHSLVLANSTGGLMASAIEYARFASAIDGNPVFPDILNTTTVKTMTTRAPKLNSDGTYYGMGWDSINSSTGEWYRYGDMQGTYTIVVHRGNGVTYELAEPSVSGDHADVEGDGLANLMEYALGLDPKTPESGSRPSLTWVTLNGQTHPALTFRRLLLAHEVDYAVEVSNDLITWNVRPESAGEPTLNPDGTLTATLRDTLPHDFGSARFLRLRVSRLPQ